MIRYAVIHASMSLERRILRAWNKFLGIKRDEAIRAEEERVKTQEQELQR